MNVLLILLDSILVHFIKNTHAELDIREELVTSTLREILTDNDSKHLEVVGVGGHGIGWYDPGSLTELMSDREFIVVLVGLGVDAEGNEGETVAIFLGHDDEAQLGERIGEVVCGSSEIGHDGAVTVLSKTDQLVVLADNLGSAFREVEGEGCLVGTEVVDVED